MIPLTQSQDNCINHLSKWKVGAIFMEAGTGKTRVACHILNHIGAKHILWVGPLRTLGDGPDCIPAEVMKWNLAKPIKYVGIESLSQSNRIYLDVLDWIREREGVAVIVDESLKIKNYNTKRTARLLNIGTLVEFRYILNGTPISRNILDLWAQMQFLSPDILKMNYRRFFNTFCDYTVIRRKKGFNTVCEYRVNGMANIDYLYSLIRNYVYKADLHLNVSQCYHDIGWNISEDGREKYFDIKEDFLRLEALDQWNNNIFMAMTTKMQHSYCCDPGKIRAMDKVMERLDHKKTIIFCRFLDSAKYCQERYKDALVLTYGKSSFGLNLQDRCNTIYFDKVWDYAMRIQSSRRTYRTGQLDDCQYYDMTGNLGLEGMIDRNIDKKISISEYFKSKTKEDIAKEL